MAIKTTYTVIDGDTVSSIALKFSTTVEAIRVVNTDIFTNARKSLAIERGLIDSVDLIFPDEILRIPSTEIDNIKDEQIIRTKAQSADELEVFINREKIVNPNTFSFTEHFDSLADKFALSYPFEPTNIAQRDRTRPLGLQNVRIFIGGELALKGEVEEASFSLTDTSNNVTLAGRSSTRVLEKSVLPTSIAREFTNLTLVQIARIVLDPFGLQLQATDTGKAFERASVEDSESVFEFLDRLAKQRSLVLSHTSESKILFRRSIVELPVYNIILDGPTIKTLGIESVNVTYKSQNIHGLYIIRGQSPGDEALESQSRSTILSENTVRILESPEGQSATTLNDMVKYEKNKAVRDLLKNSVPFPSWLIPGLEQRWRAGQYITISAPGVAIYKPFLFLINSVNFTWAGGKKQVLLDLLPPVYDLVDIDPPWLE